MILYIAPTPANRLDIKQRVSGWHFIPLDRKAKEPWREMISQLRDKNVERVIASDLNQDAAHIAGDELHIPVYTEFALRRFNVGGAHGSRFDMVADLLGKLELRWKENPDIPIKAHGFGGDSLTSFERRFARRFNGLISGTGTVLFVTDPQTIAFIRDGMNAHALIPNGNPVRRDKIYRVTTNAGTDTQL